MIRSGILYDWSAEANDPGTSENRLRDMCRDLIDECHRLRHLINDMAEFRHSKEHDEHMKKLEEISRLAGKP